MKHAASLFVLCGIVLLAAAARADDEAPAGDGILITVTQYKVDQTGKPKALLEMAHQVVVGDSAALDSVVPTVIVTEPDAPRQFELLGTRIECQTRAAGNEQVSLDLKIKRVDLVNAGPKQVVRRYSIHEKRCVNSEDTFTIDHLLPDRNHHLYVIKIEDFPVIEPE
ncbi:hypothetical protein [Rubinisphaera margarita]|uniref:hypothetical protein n=1 Tax=Rubinisphaera margarita TaxID=2909586 RepID=UPI001EE79ED1|nr:hypothetical protein [Rubinisphaera margarita]MCG6158499.1 hypothetical protein [Rubinisphaera margarita]